MLKIPTGVVMQKKIRRCANEFWIKLSQKIQIVANIRNICGMYNGIIKVRGQVKKRSPL